ncbi:alpha/beta fold hydrolase [Caldimonas brevitalea]|uniref:Sigma factor sigB regulation protein rsbQ n=1 Tax=Caldimonas brevitalea TaxID=413882 RepID=A0A0G3BQP2_9BURK|nr:alpha/beta hydrolase [Caldimonas brevitalea]AKJ30263.1 sigma factor sigB regulation protein rsbQ [Caldimonas brevitalea]
MSALLRHNVTFSGNGRVPLLFAHGYGCDQHVWRFVAPAFEEHFRVVRFDYAGAGGAAPGAYDFERHGSLRGHAEDLIEICDEAGLERPVLVAHSVATMIGVVAAGLRPELFSRLVLVAPSPCYLNQGDYVGGFEREDIDALLETLDSNYFSWARMMAPVVMGNADRPELAEDLGNSFCRTDPAVAHHFARVTFLSDNRGDLPGMRVPSLVLQCRDDALAPASVGRYLQQTLPCAQLAELQATGHCPHLSAPGETIEVIRQFLAELLERDTGAQRRSAPGQTA